MKVAEGFTQPAHDAIVSKVLTLMGTDPMDLLPQHRHLLDWDFWELGNGSTVKRQYWVASMESALQASGKKRLLDGTGNISKDHSGRPKRSRLL